MKKVMTMLCVMIFSSSVAADTLDTEHFTITITCHTQEYEVGCTSVTYKGVSKKTGEQINLQGKQIMQVCADGVTPCHSLGYEFTNGQTRYFVSEGGQLTVQQGNKVLLSETGQWIDR